MGHLFGWWGFRPIYSYNHTFKLSLFPSTDLCLLYFSLGSLFKTRCMSCGEVKANHKSPICPALEGKGEKLMQTHHHYFIKYLNYKRLHFLYLLFSFLFLILREPDPSAKDARIPVEHLPRFVSLGFVADQWTVMISQKLQYFVS